MKFWGLSWIDLLVIAIYMLGLLYIGIRTFRNIKNTADFFMGNRRFGKIFMIAHAFGTGTHTDQPVSVTGASYHLGLAGIWYQWLWLFSTPFYWLVAPLYRRMRYVTMADFFEKRFGKGLGGFYALIGLLFFMINTGIMLKGTGTTLEAMTSGAISTDLAIVAMTGIFVFYGIAGGLVAAVVTDVIQGAFIVILSFLLLPFAIYQIGGFCAQQQKLPASMFSLVAPQVMTLFFLIMIIVNGLVGVVVQPHHMAIGGAGKSELDCRMGWTFGNFIKRFCTLGWALTGVAAAALYPGLTHDNRELAFGMAVTHLLPVGFIGLMIASMLAGVMSTCDAFMVDGSALFTRNFYQRFFPHAQQEERKLLIARISSLTVVAGGLAFALYIPSVVQGLLILWKLTAFLGISFWVGIIWRRANRYGAWASFLTASGIALLTGDTFSWSWHWQTSHQIALYLSLGFAMMIIVSLITPGEPEEQLRQFYTLLQTPVGQEEKLQAENVDIVLVGEKPAQPKAVSSRSGDHLLLVDLLRLGKHFSWKKYRTDLLGFLAAWAVVVAIILLTFWIARLGA